MDVRRLLEPEEEIAFRVAPTEAGERLDRMLARRLPFASRTRVAAWIRAGRARVDGVTSERVDAHPALGQTIVIRIEKRPRDEQAAIDDLCALAPLARGAGWLAVEKPAGVPSHPAGNEIKRTLLTALALVHAAECEPGGPWLPHRLDKETSGIVLVALTRAAQQELSAAFARGAVRRVYDARVRGDATARLGAGPVDLRFRLLRSGDRPPRFRVDPRGVSAHTRARLIAAERDASQVELEPVTGRQHQLRVHLAHLGHAIAGDPLYDPARGEGERLALHARALVLPAGVCGLEAPLQLATGVPDFDSAGSRSMR
jgi:23S rRNA pseudouridine1911/1915/1917 synthase